jgi:hypothetical protein
MDLRKYLMPADKKVEFSAMRYDFEMFNSECVGSSDHNWGTIQKGMLSMNDPERDISVTRPLEYLTPAENFTYNPESMNRLLKAFQTQQIDFYLQGSAYWIKSDESEIITAIARIQTQS